MTLEGPRVLNKVLSGCATSWSAGKVATVATGVGWETVTGGLQLVQRSYFDLGGYQLEDLTTFFQGVELQRADAVKGTSLTSSTIAVLSTEYITDEEIVGALSLTTSNIGFSQSTLDQQQIIYGEGRIYVLNNLGTPGNIPSILNQTTWGTCSAATSDKLHITRIIFNDTASTTMDVPDMNVVLAIIVSREAELPFLMRQKRSYELATGP